MGRAARWAPLLIAALALTAVGAARANDYIAIQGAAQTYNQNSVEFRRDLATVTIGTVGQRVDASVAVPCVRQSGTPDASGIGDMVVHAGYVTWENDALQLAFSGAVKLPTASSDLGTGNADAAGYVGLSGRGDLRPGIFVGYIRNGSASTSNSGYEDQWDYGATLSKRLGYTGVTLGVENWHGIDTGHDTTDAALNLFHFLNPQWALTGGLQREISGKTDFMEVMLGVARWF